MNAATIWETVSISSEATEQLAEQIGNNLRGGELIELTSDLGGGKTTFTRGLVRGAGSTDRVNSPTFTLSRQYTAPQFTVAHYDFYRLSEAGIVGEELAEMLNQPGYVTVVEWGDILHEALPEKRLTIHIEYLGETSRKVRCICPAELDYLLEGLL